MLQNLAWQAIDDLTRVQLVLFHVLANDINLTQDDRQRVLDLDDREWMAWNDFLANGPLPTAPSAPEMLRRLGEASFNLSVIGAH